jgi:hypothetical protein
MKLSEDIKALIEEYEKVTGMLVEEARVNRSSYLNDHGEFFSIGAGVEVVITIRVNIEWKKPE